MKITLNPYNPYTVFSGRQKNITKEQILALRTLGKTEPEIIKELGVSATTYYNKLKKFGLSTRQKQRNDISKISKAQLEDFIKNNTPVSEVCRKLNISPKIYFSLMEKYDLTTYNVGTKDKILTKEKLQEMINQKKSMKAMCEEFGITEHLYCNLVEWLNLKTPYRSSKENISRITKDELDSLIRSGKQYEEICQILKISKSTLQTYILKFGIVPKRQKKYDSFDNITKEQLESLVNSGKPVAEICKELRINTGRYRELLRNFGILTEIQKSKANIASITKEQLQKLVDDKYTVSEICNKLNINEVMFYKLLKRLHINYNYQGHANEIPVSKDKLQQVIKEWKSRDDIEEKLNMSPPAFYEKAKEKGVKTISRDSIDRSSTALNRIENKQRNEFIKCLKNGMSMEDICKRFGISKTNYYTFLQKYNFLSSAKKQLLNARTITKEQLENLIASGKSTKEICDELNISIKTYIRKLYKFGLRDKDGQGEIV